MVERYKEQVGAAIKRRRKELGMTQKDLADAAHYKEAQSVSRWERGENLSSNLDAIAAALDWTVAEMVAGVTPPNPRVARQLGLVSPVDTPDLAAALNGNGLAAVAATGGDLALDVQQLRIEVGLALTGLRELATEITKLKAAAAGTRPARHKKS